MKATKVINHNKVGAAERVDGISVGSVTTASITAGLHNPGRVAIIHLFPVFAVAQKQTYIF